MIPDNGGVDGEGNGYSELNVTILINSTCPERDFSAILIAEKIDISTETVEKAIQVSKNKPISLDLKIKSDEEGSELGEFVEDKKTESPLKMAIDSILREYVEELLNILEKREKRILKLRFGLYDGQPKTLEEIGREFGITRERIRQIEVIALDKLRQSKEIKQLGHFF